MENAVELSDEEIGSLQGREGCLRDVINSFNARLEFVPERERKAILCLFYKELADLTFNFRLSLETRLARQGIAHATGPGEKMSVVREFETIMRDVKSLHGNA